eukprot:scaffold137_cov156-Skeletonema_menzelii.AAC.5
MTSYEPAETVASSLRWVILMIHGAGVGCRSIIEKGRSYFRQLQCKTSRCGAAWSFVHSVAPVLLSWLCVIIMRTTPRDGQPEAKHAFLH